MNETLTRKQAEEQFRQQMLVALRKAYIGIKSGHIKIIDGTITVGSYVLDEAYPDQISLSYSHREN